MKDDDDTQVYRSELEAAVKAERASCAAVCKEIAEESDAFTRDILLMAAGLIEARGQDPMPLFDDWPGGFTNDRK